MKQKNISHSHLYVVNSRQPKYPNAADDAYFTRKVLDVVTSIVAGMGLTVAMVFLATLA